MCVHIDEELRSTAYQTLQNLLSECIEWREEIIYSFLRFLTNNIQVIEFFGLKNFVNLRIHFQHC